MEGSSGKIRTTHKCISYKVCIHVQVTFVRAFVTIKENNQEWSLIFTFNTELVQWEHFLVENLRVLVAEQYFVNTCTVSRIS